MRQAPCPVETLRMSDRLYQQRAVLWAERKSHHPINCLLRAAARRSLGVEEEQAPCPSSKQEPFPEPNTPLPMYQGVMGSTGAD